MARTSKRWWQYRDEWWLVVAVLGLAFACWPVADSPSAVSHQQGQRVVGADSAIELVSKSTPKNLPANVGTMPIEAIEVGQRVLGRDPLIDDAERAQWTEPDWQHWLKLSLVMRKETGDELQIELLRPEAWLMERWQFVADRPLGWCVVSASREHDKTSDDQLSLLLAQCGPPWRTYRQQIAATTIELAAEGYELVGLTLALDLHEIGAAGEAIVTDIQPAPTVMPGNGRVVTGTFSHRTGDVIDLVLSGGSQENERIGTTSNHPFWSEDRRDYVQAGSLEEGERVLTYAGDTKRVVSKLARPGPRPVYNLEVHGEHVYHVGNDGVLVHNQNGYTGAGAPGSGPASGLLEVSSAYRSANAVKNFRSKVPTDFVFDAKTNRFVIGSRVNTGKPGEIFKINRGHPETASQAGITIDSQVVGGRIRFENGRLITDEHSGRLGLNWTPEIRQSLLDHLKAFGVDVSHTPWTP